MSFQLLSCLKLKGIFDALKMFNRHVLVDESLNVREVVAINVCCVLMPCDKFGHVKDTRFGFLTLISLCWNEPYLPNIYVRCSCE